MPMALPARRADLYFFSRAMRSRSPRVFAMLTTLVDLYLHVVVDFMYMWWLYAACGDRAGRSSAAAETHPDAHANDGAPSSPESSLGTNPPPNIDGPGRKRWEIERESSESKCGNCRRAPGRGH